MIFKLQKKVDVKYIIDTNRIVDIEIPKGMYKNIEQHNQENRTGCPAVKSATHRLFYGYPPFTITFQFGLDNNNNTYLNYNINNSEVYDSDKLRQLISNLIRVTNNENKFIDFQMQLPYSFITDDPELEVLTIPPYNMLTENVTYLNGAYKPYGWIRNQSSTWILNNINETGYITFDFNKPCIGYVFNKPVNLEYTEITPEIQNFINQNKFLLQYKTKLQNVYKTILSRRPKSLL